jgi:hypothetical protein
MLVNEDNTLHVRLLDFQFCLLCSITKKHEVLDTGFFSIPDVRVEDIPTQLRPV